MNTQHPDLLTPRLALVAITPEMLRSEQADDRTLGTLLHAAIPFNWPPVDWEPHVFAILLAQYDRTPEQIAWHRYITFRQSDDTRLLIGAAGAFWREATPTECEIGYTILPPHEGQGLATEATRALIQHIRSEGRITSVVAHTFPHLSGSIRILEKCGFTQEGPGEEPETIRFRLTF